MKKVLFASTALVAFAGAASADVALSGVAQMGLMDTNAVGVDVQFVQDIDVTFTMSGETDNGLTFGAAIDLDENAGGVGADDGGVAAFISGAFGTLTMGDTDGGFDWGMGEVALAGGSINDNETGHAGYNGNAGLDGQWDGQVLRYDHALGAFAFAVSLELKDSNNSGAANIAAPTTPAQVAAADDNVGLGVRYNLDLGGTTVALGLGYQSGTLATRNAAGAIIDLQNAKIMGVSATATLASGLSVGLNFSDLDADASLLGLGAGTATSGDYKHTGVGVGYTMGAWAFGANYGKYDRVAAGADSTGYGLAAVYDLGGGASLRLGYGSGKATAAAARATAWSFGLSMSF